MTKDSILVDISTARKILGSDKIIGISANTAEEAVTACEQGANYLGIGTIFSTHTKQNIKSVIGPEGLRRNLDILSERGYGNVPTVCIGGIKAANVMQVLFRGGSPRKGPDGVAVVSAIVAAEDPEASSRQLLDLVRKAGQLGRPEKAQPGTVAQAATKEAIVNVVPDVVKAVHAKKPLSHNMTNLV